MTELKFKRIISVSSEDDVFKAENLIHGKKWIGSKEVNTKQTAIIELEKASQIRQLDIENESSASIEIQACKESDEDFTCILSPVSFMSLSESRNKLNTNRLKVFTDEANLVQETLDTKWNRIQIICTQPFNTSLQFGISSLKVYSKSMLSDDMKEAAKINTGIFSLKKGLLNSDTNQSDSATKDSKAEPSLTKIGSLFEKYKNNSDTKDEESSSNPIEVTKPIKREETKMQVKKEEAKEDDDFKTTNTAAAAATSTPSSKKPNLFARADENKSETKKEPKPTVDKKQILKGVIFALSGFQNPERSNIRDKGLKLGAKYRPDWTDDCTHLICAFSNTPKAQMVRGQGGKIVTKDWLDECEEEGKVIDWEEFKVESKSDSEDEDKPRKAAKTAKKLIRKLKRKDDLDDSFDEEAENSEDKDFIASSDDEEEDMDITKLTSEESFDSDDSEATVSKKKSKSKKRKNSKKDKKDKKHKKKKVKNHSSSSSSSSSDSESDEEAHKKKKDLLKKNIKADNQKKNDKKVNNKENLFSSKKKEIAYDDDDDVKKNELKKTSSNKTEVNSDSDMDADKASWELPDFFEGKNFFLYGSFDPEKRKLVERSIIGFAGNLENYMSNKIDYVITNKDWNNDFKQSKNDNKNVLFLKHEWVLACAKKQRLEPFESYEIKPN